MRVPKASNPAARDRMALTPYFDMAYADGIDTKMNTIMYMFERSSMFTALTS